MSTSKLTQLPLFSPATGYSYLIVVRQEKETRSAQLNLMKLYSDLVRAAEGGVPPIDSRFVEQICMLAADDFAGRSKEDQFTGPYIKILEIVRGPLAQEMQEIWKKVRCIVSYYTKILMRRRKSTRA